MCAYNVRPMAERDIESIIAIDALVTGERGPDRAGFWRGLLSLHVPEGPPGDAEGEAPPAVPHHLCHVAEPGGRETSGVVGFIIGDVQSWQFGLPRHGRIVTIGVHPDHRRNGVARRLAEALLASFNRMGLPFVHCLVRPGDALGDFFAAMGFTSPGFTILELPLKRGRARREP